MFVPWLLLIVLLMFVMCLGHRFCNPRNFILHMNLHEILSRIYIWVRSKNHNTTKSKCLKMFFSSSMKFLALCLLCTCICVSVFSLIFICLWVLADTVVIKISFYLDPRAVEKVEQEIMSAGIVAGIVCGILVVLLLSLLFIGCR